MRKILDQNTVSPFTLPRRQFLMGAFGAALAIPTLTSLLAPRTAAAAPSHRVKRVICFPTSYGISPTMFFPAVPPASAQTQVTTSDLPLWTAPLTACGALPYGSDASGTKILGAAFAPLLAKMNLYQGLDYAVSGSQTIGHTFGALGANCRSSGTSLASSSGGRSIGFGQSIDNLIAKSKNFYDVAPSVPVLRIATTPNVMSFSYSRPGPTTSAADATYERFYLGDTDPFYALFSNVSSSSSSSTSSSAASSNANQLAITNKVLADYKNLMNHPRISKADQQILDQYVSGINELETRLQAPPTMTTATCSTSTIAALKGQLQTSVNNPVYWGYPGESTTGKTSGVTSCAALMKNINAIVQNAFLCDLTRVVTISNELFQDAVLASGTVKTEFHCHSAAIDQPMHAWFLNNVVAALAKLLDATPDPLNPGTTLLDNTVIVFTNEHSGGNAEHSGRSLPLMTIGSAGGALKTGYYFDCRQRPYTGNQYKFDTGRPVAQLLIAIMQAVGLESNEYAIGGSGNSGGFGDFESCPEYQPFAATHNAPLPFVNA